jgi:hypothetical protein
MIAALLVIAAIIFSKAKRGAMMPNGGTVAMKGKPVAAAAQSRNTAAPSFQTVAGRRTPFWRGETTIPNGRPKGGAVAQTVAKPNMGKQVHGWNAIQPIIDPMTIIPANKYAIFATHPVQYAAPVGAMENQNGGIGAGVQY